MSLAQQLALLQKPAPVDHDPEDIEPQAASEHRVDPDTNTGREHYLDVGPSTLRKLADSISDPKYDGVKVSRTQMLQSDESGEGEGEDEDEDEDGEDDNDDDDENDSGDVPSSPAREHSENEQDLHTPPTGRTESSTPNPPQVVDSHSRASNELATSLKRTREEERKKGKAVARQLAMYDSLLDARIRLQKCVSSMNMLPTSTRIPAYLMTDAARAASDNLLREALAFSDELFSLREKLLIVNESLSPPSSSHKRRKLDEDGERDGEREWEEELHEHTRHASSLESSFHPHLLTTLQKWSNKVLAIAPSALLPSAHTKFSARGGGGAANQVKSAVQVVDETLRSERERLVGRTSVFRGKGVRVGGVSSTDADQAKLNDGDGDDYRRQDEQEDADIFDDTDFYQQLLRDVIDSRSGNGAGTGLDGISEDWRAAQKQRKAKKVVDTRASKGRKLRYEVHEKLQNFMAPISAPGGAAITWHETQIDELFASLLGKGFEDATPSNGVHEIHTGGEDGERGEDRGMEVDAGALKGFRIFG